MCEEGAISGLFWQQRLPVAQGYLHPYTNLRSTPDLCPDLKGGNRKKEKNRRCSICASGKDDSGVWGLGMRHNVQKSW